MFTNNWYKILAAYINGTDNEGMKDSAGSACKSVYSSTQYMRNAFPYYNLNLGVKTSYAAGVVFGDGNTAATLGDCKLSGNIIKNITAGVSMSNGSDENGATVTGTFTITNNNSNEITIREAGLFVGVSVKYSSSANTGIVCIDRTVLDTPVTIPAGGIGQVTYTIRMNYPTA